MKKLYKVLRNWTSKLQKLTYGFFPVLQFARSYSNGTPIDCKWLLLQTDYPWILPKTIKSLAKLEEVHEIMDMYLWLR